MNRASGASTSGRRAGATSSSGRVATAAVVPRRASRRASAMVVLASASAPNMLQKLGRVLREKAAGDLERFVQGTSKTRERLGVSRLGAAAVRVGVLADAFFLLALLLTAAHRPYALPSLLTRQLVEELLTFWSLEDYETTLEELEEVLIVSCAAAALVTFQRVGNHTAQPCRADVQADIKPALRGCSRLSAFRILQRERGSLPSITQPNPQPDR